MIVLKRRPLPQRIRYSYRAYRALGINAWHSLRMALHVAAAGTVSAWICRWFYGHIIKADFNFATRQWSYWCERCNHPLKGPQP